MKLNIVSASNVNPAMKAVIIAILLIIVGCLLGIVFYQNSSEILEASIKTTMIRRAEENADLVHRVLEVYKTNIEGVASRSEIQSMDWRLQKPVLLKEADRLGVLRFQIADTIGNAISTNGTQFNISDREHFQKALQGYTVISDPMIARVDGEIIIVCAAPVHGSEGKIQGVLTAVWNPRFLFDIIKDRKIGETGYGLMLNSEGLIIAHPNIENILAESMATRVDRTGFDNLTQLELEMMKGNTGFGFYKFDNQSKCMSYAPIPGNDWSLGLTVPYSEVFSEIYKLRKQFFIVTIMVIVVSLVLNGFIISYSVEKKKATALRKDNEASKKLLEESEELDRIRTQFFANISHELRTPLNVVSGTVQLLELYLKTNPELKSIEKHIKALKQNSRRLMRLINNLIDSTRIDAGFLDINLRYHNIVSVVEEIVLSTSDYARMKGINLVFDTDREEVTAALDIEKFERVILNLMSNAIKYTPKGGEISVTVSGDKERVKISVKDTGIGIPKEKSRVIFDRFIQVDQSLTRSHEGSGIGLSLVKSLVEMHEGKIEVFSEEGDGSEFIVELPVAASEDIGTGSGQTGCISSYTASENKVQEEFSDIY